MFSYDASLLPHNMTPQLLAFPLILPTEYDGKDKLG